MEAPVIGEWRYAHPEKAQSFADFQKSKRLVPTDGKNIIYLRPIGEFTKFEEAELKFCRDYLEAFFQLETEILPTADPDIIPRIKKRLLKGEHEQWHAGFILNRIMKKDNNEDQIAVMGITSKDIYPRE